MPMLVDVVLVVVDELVFWAFVPLAMTALVPSVSARTSVAKILLFMLLLLS
jgi:hypothetical protein